MQTAFSLPKNEGFFQRYATLVPVLSKLGVFAQIINGLTEFGILNAIVLAHIAGLFGGWSWPLSIVAAVFGVVILELGQRTFLPYSARAVLYRRFSGLDLWMSFFIFGVTVCLFGASLYLSFKGSHDLVAATAPPPKLASTAAADSVKMTAQGEAEKAYQYETKETGERFAALIAATKNATAAQVSGHKAQLQQIAAKEHRTGQSYTSERNAQTNKINALESDCAAKVAALETQKATEMQAAKDRRRAALDEANKAREKVDNQNETATTESREQVAAYGGGLGWLTVIFHLVLVLSIVLDEMHKKGSGIEQQAAPNQYHFSQSVWAMFWNTVSEKWNYATRSHIQRWADKTPPPPRPGNLHPLFELSDWKPKRLVLPNENNATAPPPNLNGKHTEGHNGKPHRTFSALNLRIDTERAAAIFPTNGTAPAPAHDNAMSNAQTLLIDSSLKPCAFCNTPFKPRTTWQKFCSQDCKLNEHEQRTGQRFDPNKAKFKKKANA